MGIRVSGIDEIIRQLKEDVKEVMEEIAGYMSGIGEEVVKGIINGETSSWNDQTGNLRSSIGYIVTIDGEIRGEGGFQSVGNATDGSFRGRQYAQSLIPQFPQGVALIIVAGMDYAAYVEAMDNKTVLAQGELEAKRLIDQMVHKLNQRYSK